MNQHALNELRRTKGPCVLLYANDANAGWRHTLLADNPKVIYKGNNPENINLNGRLFGYFAYGGNSPDFWLMQTDEWSTFKASQPLQSDYSPPPIVDLTSNMSRANYLNIIAETLEAIRAGSFYQANVTRKFYGRFESAPDPKELFIRLQQSCPMPFAAYINTGEVQILSASPEEFITVNNGHAIVRPMKGTAPRHADPAKDTALKQSLEHSEKDKAENLMIVDLMRNDLSRICHHVAVESLHQVHSFPGVHQMISTISGEINAGSTALDAMLACFPPGSMTGAPKLAAMEWCNKMEGDPRGIYSGALGWMDAKACQLSVIIRTIIIRGDAFEFQVGGGIVADSDPENEWAESLLKAEPLAELLGIPMDRLRAL